MRAHHSPDAGQLLECCSNGSHIQEYDDNLALCFLSASLLGPNTVIGNMLACAAGCAPPATLPGLEWNAKLSL
jgi:hypothetical protein